jgi:hypothetical protein
MVRADHTVSIRLIQVLRTYCYNLDARQLGDLRSSLAFGRYPWFRDELAEAIRADAFDRADWESAVGPRDKAIPHLVRSEQRLIWAALFDDAPFPQRRRRPAAAKLKASAAEG